MKRAALIMLGGTALGLGGCSSIEDIPSERLASARLETAAGIPVGTVQLLAAGDRLSLAVAVTGIEPGPHGFHLHTTGACKAPDFTSAGGHLNPLGKEHGSMNPQGAHLGDLPNLDVGSSRTASTTIELDDDRAQVLDWLFDDDGTAVVIHAGPDDYKSDPAGAAGSRIACGVMRRL